VPSGNRHYANRRDELLRDGLNLNTLLSQREYRTDAFYLIAIWQKQQEVEYSLEALRQALMQPKYNLYLGRKSCSASLPLFPQTVKDKTLKQSFDQYAQNNTEQWLKQLVPTAKVSDSLVSYYWEPGLTQEQLGEQMVSTMTYTKKDQLRSRQRWQYTDREEFYCVHPYSHSEPSQSEDNALSTEGGR
jgi:CRISPR system Cascade subunit CasD